MPVVQVSVSTLSREEILDITEEVRRVVVESGVATGLVCISAPHGTCAVYVNENERDSLRT